MVKNAPSSSNLRGSATLPLRPSQSSTATPLTFPPSSISGTVPPPTNLTTATQAGIEKAAGKEERQRRQEEEDYEKLKMRYGRDGATAGGRPIERLYDEEMEDEFADLVMGRGYKGMDGRECTRIFPGLGESPPEHTVLKQDWSEREDEERNRSYYTRQDGTKGYRSQGPDGAGGYVPSYTPQSARPSYPISSGSRHSVGYGLVGGIQSSDRAPLSGPPPPPPPPPRMLFSNYGSDQKWTDAATKPAAGDGREYTPTDRLSPIHQQQPHTIEPSSQAYNQPSYDKTVPNSHPTLGANTEKQKSLYETYVEEAKETLKIYKQSMGARAGSDKLPSLYEKYHEDMTEANRRYENGQRAQVAAQAGGILGFDSQTSFPPACPQFARAPQPAYPHSSYQQFPVANAQLRDTANAQGTSLITRGLEDQQREHNTLKSPETYTQPFCDFLTENPTVWHAVQYFEKKLDAAGFKKLSERKTWNSTLEKGGKYYTTRNGSSLIAFTVGNNYKSGNGVAMVAGHVDALTARLKPVSSKITKAGYVQLGIAPYAGALNSTWWDRDLGIGGRVLVKDGKTGKIETKLVKLGWPIARIPTLAPHFGVGMTGTNNSETEAVPIIGLDSTSSSTTESENLTLGGASSFAATQPPKLVRAIAGELSIQDYSSIVNWELELYDTQPAQVGGLDKEFIFAGRIDDKLCSWSAMEALLASASSTSSTEDDGVVKLVGVFDDEEIGSLLRQGARGNFLPSTISRIVESFSPSSSANILSQTHANSFLISADVTHAVNPNFLSRYLENHAPRLNVGLVVCADSNGHMTTDSVSTALLTRIAEKSGSELQLFMIRNDSRSGGTVGPMLSAAMGVRAIDAGIPQLSMHSIRATTGALDPGLGVKIFAGFFEHFEGVDGEFE